MVNFDDALAALSQEYNTVCAQRDEALQKLKSYDTDERVQKLKDKNKDLREHSLLQLTHDELIAERTFRNVHFISCRNSNVFEYRLTGTGLGVIIEITCPKCGKCLDITDSKKF